MKTVCAGCGVGWTEGKGWDGPHIRSTDGMMCVNERYGWLWTVELTTPPPNEKHHDVEEHDASD